MESRKKQHTVSYKKESQVCKGKTVSRSKMPGAGDEIVCSLGKRKSRKRRKSGSSKRKKKKCNPSTINKEA